MTESEGGRLCLRGDGFLNWEEFVAGTDPQDSNSFLRVEIDRDPELGIQIVFPQSLTTRIYAVLGTDTLEPASWLPVAEPQSGTGSTLQITPTNVLTHSI